MIIDVKGIYKNWIDDPDSTITIIMVDDSFSVSGIIDNSSRFNMINNLISQILNNMDKNSNLLLSSITQGSVFSGKIRNLPKIKYNGIYINISSCSKL